MPTVEMNKIQFKNGFEDTLECQDHRSCDIDLQRPVRNIIWEVYSEVSSRTYQDYTAIKNLTTN